MRRTLMNWAAGLGLLFAIPVGGTAGLQYLHDHHVFADSYSVSGEVAQECSTEIEFPETGGMRFCADADLDTSGVIDTRG